MSFQNASIFLMSGLIFCFEKQSTVSFHRDTNVTTLNRVHHRIRVISGFIGPHQGHHLCITSYPQNPNRNPYFFILVIIIQNRDHLLIPIKPSKGQPLIAARQKTVRAGL